MVLSEGTTEKIPSDTDPRTVRLVAQRLNHYATHITVNLLSTKWPVIRRNIIQNIRSGLKKQS